MALLAGETFLARAVAICRFLLLASQYPVRIKSSGTRESLEPTTVCLVCESKDYEGERFNMLARGFGSWRH